MKQLSEEDRKALGGYLIRVKMGEAFGGKRHATRHNRRRCSKAAKGMGGCPRKEGCRSGSAQGRLAAEKAAAVDKLNKIITVTLLGKEQVPKNFEAHRYSETQLFHIGVQNNSDKPIAGVAGEMKFIDIFDKEIGA